MLFGINNGHKRLSDWAMPHLPLSEDAYVLDVGCGGGANFAVLLKRSPEGQGRWSGSFHRKRGGQPEEK